MWILLWLISLAASFGLGVCSQVNAKEDEEWKAREILLRFLFALISFSCTVCSIALYDDSLLQQTDGWPWLTIISIPMSQPVSVTLGSRLFQWLDNLRKLLKLISPT